MAVDGDVRGVFVFCPQLDVVCPKIEGIEN